MGDSVVKGVGCRRVGEGPTLPRHVAEVVAEQLGAEVGWRALGETGADIPMLREQFIPLLRREVERCAQSGERVDAVEAFGHGHRVARYYHEVVRVLPRG